MFINNAFFRYTQSHGNKFIPGTDYTEDDRKEIISDVLKIIMNSMSPAFRNELLIVYDSKALTNIIFEMTAITINIQLEEITNSGFNEEKEESAIKKMQEQLMNQFGED